MRLRPGIAKLSIVVALAATIPLFASASGQDGSAGGRTLIEIKDFAFAATTTVAVGDTVVWINRDIVPHTATAADGSWDSGEIKPGESWEMVVPADLALDYYCVFHPAMVASLKLDAA